MRIADSYRDEWKRRVEENMELMREIQDIRTRYGFPLPNIDAYNQFVCENGIIKARLDKEIDDLIAKHKLPENWRQPIFGLVVMGWALGYFASMGFPTVILTRDFTKGTYKREIIIDDSTDLKNPIVLDYIERERDLIRDTCPKPTPMKNNPRKLDWRPVLEYKKRHPGITHAQIAKMINYSPGVVRRKLAEIDQDIDNAK